MGPTICDPAIGSAGFLCESFDYLKAQNPKRTTAQDRTLQERTFYGKEKKSLAYVIAIMNMILHGIEARNIARRQAPESRCSHALMKLIRISFFCFGSRSLPSNLLPRASNFPSYSRGICAAAR